MVKNDITGERLARLETNVDYIKNKIDDLSEQLTKHINDESRDVTKIRKECDKRYASKLTEIIVYGLVGTVLLTVLGAILFLVIK